jgi:PKHD-type hydroxylase
MILRLSAVLSANELRDVRGDLAQAQWADGRSTAGYQSARAKRNDQVVESDPSGARAGERVVAALERNALFVSAALPLRVFPPLFNRYGSGQAFGDHVDNAIRQSLRGNRIRTDLSATLFLNPPENYDGGELVIGDAGGSQIVKLAAGDMVLYPASSVHRVNPVTRGTRLASFFWIQSMVRDEAQRSILFQLDEGIRGVRDADVAQPALVTLVNVYHNLVRSWAEC